MSETQVQTGDDQSQVQTPPQGGVSTSADAETKTQTSGETNGKTSSDGTLASSAETKETESKPYWPEDWRDKLAEHASAGDKKTYEKELKRLSAIPDPTQVYASWRAIENTWSSRNFIKLPGKDAKTEEVAEYHKALGVPETPDGYLKDLKLDDGLVLGDWDMPVVKGFTEAVHKEGAPPRVVSAALNWYLKEEEEKAAALDESDDSYRRVSEQALKNEYGNAYRRYTNNIATLFQTAPGGIDLDNEESVYARVLGGRTADGQIIGNDPDIIRWFVALANNLNPAGTVVEDGDQSGKSVDSEIAEIEKIMRSDRRLYDKQYAQRYGELLAAREKLRARAR